MRKKIHNFLSNPHLQLLALLAIALFISVSIRMQSASLPMADDWAQNSVYSSLRNNIRAEIEKQNPGIAEAQKNALVEQQFQQALVSYKDELDKQIKANAQTLKDVYQDPQGRVYNLNIDPYYYMRWARNYLDHGYIGDELRNGQNFDNHMYAPIGAFIGDAAIYPYALVFLYKVMHFLNSGMTLEESSKYLPVLLSALAVIPAFLMGRRLSNNVGGFFTALIIATNVAMLSRTMFGDADNDSYSIFFPVTIVWLFVESLEAKTLRNKCIFAGLTGMAIGFYSFAWAGWWYVFDFLLATLGLSLVYFIFAHRAELKGHFINYAKHSAIRDLLAVGLFLILFAGMVTSILIGFSSFRSAPLSPFDFMKIKDASRTNLWPNVYTTVAELNPGSFNEVVNTMGGQSLFWISLLGIALTMFKRDADGSISFKEFPLLLMWLAGTIYATGYDNKFYLLFWSSIVGFIILFIIRKLEVGYLFLLSSWLIWSSVAYFQFYPNAFWIMVLCLILAKNVFVGLKKEEHTKLELRYILLLSLWFAGTIYASTKGVRFNLLVVPAFAVGFGAAAGILYHYFSRSFSFRSGDRKIEIPKILTGGLVIMAFLWLMSAPIATAYSIPKSSVPLVNDAWYDSLTDIKEKTPANTIITSWWDYGHIFKYIADRPVTFDGASQNVPQAHWVGRLLLTDNEDEAIGILRMLDCGANTAYDRLDAQLNNTAKSVRILHQIILMDKDTAKKTLEGQNLSGSQSDEVLKYTHCDPPPAVVIASEDMIGKAGVWAHFGSWDFDRADWWMTARGMEREPAIQKIMADHNRSRDRAQQIVDEVKSIPSEDAANSWIAPWPTYRSGLTGCGKNGETIRCDGIGLTVNTATMDATLSMQGAVGSPASLVYMSNSGVEEKKFEGRTIPISAVLIPAQNGYYGMLADPNIANSMFTRMFFLNGYGLKHFELLTQKSSPVGTQVYVWKVKWN